MMLPLRLGRVAGHEGRHNDALFQPATRPSVGRNHTLVYFGGDVQDYPELMQAHRDNRHYLRWNLENTARILSQNFPHKHILIVRPSRIEYKSFSCYDNFVPSNSAGVPDHTPTHGALQHLERLLQNVSNLVKSMSGPEIMEAVSRDSPPENIDIEELRKTPSSSRKGKAKYDSARQSCPAGTSSSYEHKPEKDPLWWREKLSLDEGLLTLVGFSKGCVVLNQFIYEFHYVKTLTPGDVRMMRFIERVENMYWLDGGHAGGKNTWITSRSLLETLTRLDINIYVHVSPYQIHDEGRPWIGREERAFSTLLNKMGAKVSRFMHEHDMTPQSLHVHFQVLANFKRVQDNSAPTLLDSGDEDT